MNVERVCPAGSVEHGSAQTASQCFTLTSQFEGDPSHVSQPVQLARTFYLALLGREVVQNMHIPALKQ